MIHNSSILLLVTVLFISFTLSNAHAQSDDHDEQEETISFPKLPEQVKEAFNSSTYSDWQITEVEKAPSTMRTKYKVEVKNGSGKHLGLYYDRDGDLFRKEDETKEEDEDEKKDEDER